MGFLSKASRSSETMSQNTDVILKPQSTTERQAEGLVSEQLNALQAALTASNRTPEYESFIGGQKSFAETLGRYANGEYLPNQSDITRSNDLASQLFGAQRVGLQQSFQNQIVDSNNLATRLGRSINDPIIQSKLRTNFMNQEAQLNAEQSAFAAQNAMSMPGQRLGYQQQGLDVLANILNSSDALRNQANNNRIQLLNLGQSVLNQYQTFRLNTAGKTGTGTTTSNPSLLSNLGAVAGIAGTAASAFSGIGGGGGGGAAASATPTASPISGFQRTPFMMG